MESRKSISNEKGNWYIVEIIEKCEPVDRNEHQDLRRVSTWGNHILIRANSPSQAYSKGVKHGKDGEYKFTNVDQIKMESIFVGIGNLLPIYESHIEDGSELMWTDYGSISDRRTQRFIPDKETLLDDIKPKKKPKSK